MAYLMPSYPLNRPLFFVHRNPQPGSRAALVGYNKLRVPQKDNHRRRRKMERHHEELKTHIDQIIKRLEEISAFNIHETERLAKRLMNEPTPVYRIAGGDATESGKSPSGEVEEIGKILDAKLEKYIDEIEEYRRTIGKSR